MRIDLQPKRELKQEIIRIYRWNPAEPKVIDRLAPREPKPRFPCDADKRWPNCTSIFYVGETRFGWKKCKDYS